MHTQNKTKIRKLTDKMRAEKMLRSPQSIPYSDMGFGMFSSGLDRISKLMQEYTIQNQISGMGDPGAFDKALFSAQLGMKMGASLSSGRLMSKFVQEHYQYVTHPAIRALGSAGGKKYGYILENYMQTKSDIKKSWGDIGQNIGSGIALGFTLLSRGLKLTSVAAAASGVGIPVALATFVASIAIDLAVGFVLPWAGRKIGEAVAEKGGFVEKYSAPSLGRDMLSLVPEGAQHFKSVASSVYGQSWHNPQDSYNSYFSTMKGISQRKTNGISMYNLGMTARETGSLYDAVSKNLNVDNSMKGYYTSTLGTLKGITGEDFTSTFAGISQGVAKSKKELVTPSGEIDATAEAFKVFFDAVSQGGRNVNKSALDLTKNLAEAANVYSKKNISVENVDVMFSGVQKFVQNNMQTENKQDVSEASDIVGIMDKVAKSTGESPFATQLTQYAGLGYDDALRGLDADGLKSMSMAISNTYDFAGDASVDRKTGALKMGKKGEFAWNELFLDATRDKESGGLGLTSQEAQLLIKYIISFQNNPDGLTFDGKITDPISNLGKEMHVDALLSMSQTEAKISNHYESLTSMFADDYVKLSENILRFSAKVTEDIAKGALDLLISAKRLTEEGGRSSAHTPWDNAGGLPGSEYYGPSGHNYIAPGRSVISRDNMLIAQEGFREEIAGAAKRAGVDLKTLYAFFGAESAFGTNVRNYRGMDYVGVGQIGQEAQDHMNRVNKTNLNRFKRSDNILLAAFYIDYLRDRYVKMKKDKDSKLYGLNFDPNDARFLYMAYNWGMGNLDNHIIRNGGVNWEALPKETKTGVGNVERAMAGYDASEGSLTTPFSSTEDTTQQTVKYAGGVWRYKDDGARSGRFSANATLLNMSGVQTQTGNKMANYMENLYKKSANTQAYLNACAMVANLALDASGFKTQRTGYAYSDRDNWVRNSSLSGATFVLNFGDIPSFEFQPGDLIYVAGKQGLSTNHVGVVTYDGTILQAGTAYDANRKTHLIRTDINEFKYGTHIVVVRASADANLDGTITPDEAIAMRQAMVDGKKAKPPKPPEVPKDNKPSGRVTKGTVGSQVRVNANVNKAAGGNLMLKTRGGAGLSKGQVAKIKSQEATLEKALGLDADDLSFTTQSGKSGTFLNIKINVPLGDVGKVSQEIINYVERLI